MGFWQGVYQGIQDFEASREREKERADRKAEIEEERRLRREEIMLQRKFQIDDYERNIKLKQQEALYELLKERSATQEDTLGLGHNLKTLKALGASDEALAEAASYGAAALEEATKVILTNREKYAGSPVDFGPAMVDVVLDTAVSTVEPGKTPDFEAAAALYGLDPEKLDEPLLGGMTGREVLAKALTEPPKSRTTFLYGGQGKPLETSDLQNIQETATTNLLDVLSERQLSESQEATLLREKESKGITLTEDELRRKDMLNNSLFMLEEAKQALEKGSPSKAISLVGGQAIMPLIANNPIAAQYSFGSGWSEAIRSYTFEDEEELMRAAAEGRIKPNDIVIVGGVVGTVR